MTSTTLLLLLATAPFVAASGPATLVSDGQPMAQIRIANNPPRMVELAAAELRDYVEKLSGARLPIVTDGSGILPVTIHIGRNAFTDQRGVADEGLDFGAFRMIADGDSLILFGRDFDFEPIEPWARSAGDRQRAMDEWDAISGSKWGNPMNNLGRHWNRASGIWAYDEGGSLNAVYQLLRDLGVRWYMPGELGEVVPQITTIQIPEQDRTIRPDFRVRHWMLGNYANTSWDELLWERRVGIGSLYEALGAGMLAHGMRNVQARDEIKAAHPEYFALIGGKRDTDFRGTGHACFSSAGLLEETVAYVRTVYDHFGSPTVQLSPQDGYRHCQCDDCRDQLPSDLVFSFIDQVAKEVYASHPDRLIIAAAYGQYREPPDSISRFSPNLAVSVNNVGRALFMGDQEHWQWYQDLVDRWQEKLAPGRVLRVENNLSQAKPFPRIHPRSVAKDLQAMNGTSMGERNEIPRSGADRGWPSPGATHLTLYTNARFLWDADQDVDAFLDEYFELFYGPAAAPMQAAFEFAEASNSSRGRGAGRMDYSDGIQFLEQLLAAKEIAGNSIYGERIALILHEIVSPDGDAPVPPNDELVAATRGYIELLRQRVELLRLRAEARPFRIWHFDNHKWDAAWKTFKLDGRLDEEFWSMRGRMPQLTSADGGNLRTSFQIGTTRDALYIGIHCEETSDDPPVSGTSENYDPAITAGDSVEIFIETDLHSYYQIVVNPAGAVLYRDLAEGGQANWTALADVATHIGDDFWSAEIRIPITRDTGDPVHEMVMQQLPSAATPWAFNIIRNRIRNGEAQQAAFSPDDGANPRDVTRFANLVR